MQGMHVVSGSNREPGGKTGGKTPAKSIKKRELKIEEKLKQATEYLKSIGCKEIILFGSLANGMADESSDIDLTISGISPRTYFKTVAVISSLIGWKVDLVTMDHIPKDFKEKILAEGRRLYAI